MSEQSPHPRHPLQSHCHRPQTKINSSFKGSRRGPGCSVSGRSRTRLVLPADVYNALALSPSGRYNPNLARHHSCSVPRPTGPAGEWSWWDVAVSGLSSISSHSPLTNGRGGEERIERPWARRQSACGRCASLSVRVSRHVIRQSLGHSHHFYHNKINHTRQLGGFIV